MFSDGMKKRREALGLSQTGLSNISGVPQSTISAVEKGTRIPKEDTMVMIANGLNCTVGELLGEDDKSPPSDDDGLRAWAIERVSALPDPALLRVRDFLAGLEAGQGIGAAPAAAPDPSGQSSQ